MAHPRNTQACRQPASGIHLLPHVYRRDNLTLVVRPPGKTEYIFWDPVLSSSNFWSEHFQGNWMYIFVRHKNNNSDCVPGEIPNTFTFFCFIPKGIQKMIIFFILQMEILKHRDAKSILLACWDVDSHVWMQNLDQSGLVPQTQAFPPFLLFSVIKVNGFARSLWRGWRPPSQLTSG